MYTTAFRVWRKFLLRVRRERVSREMDEELETHRLMKQDELSQRGLPNDRAATVTRREMGNVTLAKEECRDMWSFLWFERLLQDLRYASRIFRRAPVFTAVAVASLAVGIGGNAAMFSLVNALLIRPLPYFQPERLVRITGIYPRAAVPFFKQRNQALDIAAVSTGSEMNLAGKGASVRVFGSNASADFLDVLGSSVARGRGFQKGEDAPSRDGVVLIGDSLWKSKFDRDPATIGRVITVNGINRQIIGVMASGFHYPSAKVQLWIPMRLDPSNFNEYWGAEFVPLIGRLHPSATVAEAREETRRLTSDFRKTFPYPMARNWNADSTVISLQRDITGDVHGKLIVLLAAVGMVLLIACANVASLLLSRATTRRKEIALRASLGAGRLRIVRQLLTESTLLALLGAALGILLGRGVLSIFKALLPASLPGLAEAAIDLPTVALISAVALLTGLAFGLAPALSASQVSLTETIKTGSQRSTGGFWVAFRSSLIVAEVALTLVLAVTAGLLLRTLYELSHSAPGFNPAHILAVHISPNQATCKQREACIALYNRLISQASGISGVGATAIANSIPLDGEIPALPVDVEGHPKTAGHPAPMLWFGAVGGDYFKMLHIPLLAGRYLNSLDGANTAPVAVISASTARHFWPHESALGKHVRRSADDAKWRTIVGVVADTRQYTLSTPLPAWMEGSIYMPYAQSEREDAQIPAAMSLLVKSQFDNGALRNDIHRIAEDVDPDAPAGVVRPFDDIVASSISDFRALMRVFLSFAGVAMLLAAIGIYGLMSYWVTQRTYEIGLRVSIGATRGQILSMIFRQGLRLSAIGIAGGIVTALGLTQFLRTLLYGVAPTDGLTFLGVTALVLCVTALATAFPAWRASQIDPVRSLRVE